ncbi:hypothetical protein FGRMN_8656 [Fusarium graminum]|nr:hypothetical protein FGRMN_8656 [Fusarium graminum]
MASLLRIAATTFTSTFLLSLLSITSAQECKFRSLNTSYPAPVTAPNWEYSVIANKLRRPRGLVFDTEGALLVIDSGNGIVRFELEDGGGTCLQVKKKTTLLKQDNKYPDMLLVSRGSNGNDDEGTEDRDSGRSQLRAFNISSFGDNSSKKPYKYTDGEILGWGLRNSVGVAEHPKTGGIFSVENSADELHRDGTDIHKDNPAEEMNFHGFLNGSSEDQGGNYGYPLCYTLWSTEGFPNLGDLKIGDQFPADRQTGEENATSRTDKECKSDYVAPVLAFQAHTAPLDLKFDSDGTRAYISFHGSYFENGQPAASSRSKKAITPIISNKDISKCPDECFRPVGLAWDPKGRLWFTSDKTGEIFVLNQTSTSDNGTSSGGDDDDDDDNSALSLRPGWAASIVTLAAVIMGGFLA